MKIIISTHLIQQTLKDKTCSSFYQNHYSELQQFAKHIKYQKVVETECYQLFLEFLCVVLDDQQSDTKIHSIVVLMNTILNNKNQLIVRIISQRKIVLKLINYFKNTVQRFQTMSQLQTDKSTKIDFEIYSILHLITILLNYQSKHKNVIKYSLFKNNLLINALLMIDLQILIKRQSVYLISIVFILLLKNLDLKKYGVRIKYFIFKNIAYVIDQRARKNMIQSLKRIIVSTKIKQTDITNNNIIQWIINCLRQRPQDNNVELLSLAKIVLFKFPYLMSKFISLNFLDILRVIFNTNCFHVCQIYDLLIPFLNIFQKETLHNFLLNSLQKDPKIISVTLSKLVSNCSFHFLIDSLQQGLLDKVYKSIKIESSLNVQNILIYLQNLIQRISQLNQQFGLSLIQMIFISNTLKSLQYSQILEIKVIYSNFKKIYQI